MSSVLCQLGKQQSNLDTLTMVERSVLANLSMVYCQTIARGMCSIMGEEPTPKALSLLG